MNVRTYVRQVGVLLFGNVAAQLVNLGSYPVLTRLYLPADFGGFALFLTAVGILGPVACARFDLPIQSSKNWQLAAVFRQALWMNALVSAVATLLAGAYGLFTGKMGLDLAVLVGIGVFLSGYTLAALALLVRLERYRLYSRSLMIRSLATAAGQIGLWLALPGALGLIIGFCLGSAAQATSLWWSLRNVQWRRSTSRHRRAIAARYRRQVMTDVPSTLVAGVVLNIMNVLLLALYSRVEVGYYSLAFRVAVLPLSLISGSLSEVFFQKASASYRASGAFWNELRFNVLASAALSLFIFGPLAILARTVFGFAFGRGWLPAADLLILLLPMLVVRFVSLTIQTAPLVVGRANWLLAQNLGLVTAIVAAFLLARDGHWPIDRYVLLTSVSMSAVYLAFILYVSMRVWRSYRKPGDQGSTRAAGIV
jgi:O-antigen/teichoic acid export membrane protein